MCSLGTTMCNVSISPPVRVVTGTPTDGNALLLDSPNASPSFVNHLDGTLNISWDGFGSGTVASPFLRYELCVGRLPFACDFDMVATQSLSSALIAVDMLQCGGFYHATVRATNCAGLQHSVASAAVKLCCQPPVGAGITLSNRHGRAVQWVSNDSVISVSWGAFTEACAGVREYSVSVLDLETGTELWSWSAGLNRSVTLPVGTCSMLPHSTECQVVVHAFSHAAHVANVSASLTVDHTGPVPGYVFASSSSLPISCHGHSTPLGLTWTGFDDAESGVYSVEWAVALHPALQLVKPFEPLDGSGGDAPREWANSAVVLQPGVRVRNLIRVTNHAGSTVLGGSAPVLLVDDVTCAADRQMCIPWPRSPLTLSHLSSELTRNAFGADSALNLSSTDPASASSYAAIHPLFLPLVLGLMPNHIRKGSELVYHVSGVAEARQLKGTVAANMTVRLRPVLTRPSDGAQLVRMQYDSDAMLFDEKGDRFPMEQTSNHSPTKHPVYFWQGTNRSILEMLHDGEDDAVAVASKKMLLDMHQLTVVHPGRRSLTENLGRGQTVTNYTVKRGLFGRSAVTRTAVWPGELHYGRVHQQETLDAIVDRNTGLIRRIKSIVRISGQQDDFDPTFAEDGLQEPSGQTVENFRDVLPKRPIVTMWKLVEVRLDRKRRRLFDDGFVDQETQQHIDSFVRSGIVAQIEMEDIPRTQGYDAVSHGGGSKRPDCRPEAVAEKSRELALCTFEKEKDARLDCIEGIILLVRGCPDQAEPELDLKEILITECQGEHVSVCGGVLNGLGALVNVRGQHSNDNQAQGVLADFFEAASATDLPVEAMASLAAVERPSPRLMQSLATLVSTDWRFNDTKGAPYGAVTEGAAADDKLNVLMLAAALAGRVISMAKTDASVDDAPARLIARIVRATLDADRKEDAVWSRRLSEASKSADDMWSSMHAMDQHAWVGHHHQLNRKALAHEADQGRYDEHESVARDALVVEHYRRHRRFHQEKEDHQLRRLTTSLRAMGNLGAKGECDPRGVARLIDHRDRSVSEASIDALRSFENERTEEALLELVNNESPREGHLSHHNTVRRTTLRAVGTFLKWDLVGEATFSWAVRELLKLHPSLLLNKDRVGPKRFQTPADRRCTAWCRARSNPHLEKKHRRARCVHACEDQVWQ